MSKEQYLHLTLKPEGWAVVDMPEEPERIDAFEFFSTYEIAKRSAIASATLIVPDQQGYAEDLVLNWLGGLKDKVLEQGEVYRVHFEGEIKVICAKLGPCTCLVGQKCKEPILRLLPKESVKEESKKLVCPHCGSIPKWPIVLKESESETVGEGDKEAIAFGEWIIRNADLLEGEWYVNHQTKSTKELFEEYKNKAK